VSVKIVDMSVVLFRSFCVWGKEGLGVGAAAEGSHPEHETPSMLLQANYKFLEVGGSPYLCH
jgi:hypothetical protein